MLWFADRKSLPKKIFSTLPSVLVKFSHLLLSMKTKVENVEA